MDKRTGKILTEQEMRDLISVGRRREDFQEMTIAPTHEQRKKGRIYRNDLCPCGSGLKFKKCCLIKER